MTKFKQLKKYSNPYKIFPFQVVQNEGVVDDDDDVDDIVGNDDL